MSTHAGDAIAIGVAQERPETAPARAPRRAGGGVWWRHLLGILALIWALFPIVFLISAALNPAGSLQTS